MSDSDYVVQTENLTKRYGEFTALDDLTIHVKRGENIGFHRSQRCRQDNHDQNPGWFVSADVRDCFDCRGQLQRECLANQTPCRLYA